MSVDPPFDAAALEALPLICWATDSAGRVRFLSRMAATTLGLVAEEGVGQPVPLGASGASASPSTSPSGSLRALLAPDAAVLATGQRIQAEELVRVATGERRRWLVLRFPLALGGQRHVVGVALDVETSAPVASRHADLGEATFRQILDAITDMVLVKGPQSRLLWANRAFLEVYGMTNEQLDGLIDAPFVEPDVTQQYVKDDQAVFATGLTLDIPEEPVTSHAGRVLICQTVKSPIFGPDGQVTRTVGVSRDISERKRLEQQMVAAKEAAEAAVRAKSEFLATMSHEIRTPLNGVLGMIEILMTTKLTEEQRTYATSLQACGRALLGLIGNVLNLSKIEAGRLQLEIIPFDPKALIEECLLVVADLASSKRLLLVFTYGRDIPALVMGDRDRIRQVLINLLGNAVRFTETGGVSIDLTARASPYAPSDAPASDGSGDATAGPRRFDLEFAVEDTGIGMSAETRLALFRPFFQADDSTTRRYGGTGLGLSISKRIADQMGGRIDVHSILGQGSRFTLVFRCVEAPATSQLSGLHRFPLTPPVARPDRNGVRPRLLVVEDNAVNRMVILKQLSLLGHAADVASNGAEAVALWQRQPYDLVLMDCQMPVMDGFEATRRILVHARNAGGAPPIIVAVTASATDGDGEMCLAAGMSDYLSKPVGIADLRRILQRWT